MSDQLKLKDLKPGDRFRFVNGPKIYTNKVMVFDGFFISPKGRFCAQYIIDKEGRLKADAVYSREVEKLSHGEAGDLIFS